MTNRRSGVQVRVHRDVRPATLAGVGGLSAIAGAAAGAVAGWRLARRDGPPVVAAPEPAPDIGAPIRAGATRGEAVQQRQTKPLLRRLDRFQQRRPVIGFPLAVAKKFGEDQAGSLAALIAYYGFLSLFPLLLALTTILALVLHDDADLQRRILDSALAQFPVLGDQIRENVKSLRGSGIALVVGVAGALWGGMGVMRSAGTAMDEVWEVPKRDRPRFLRSLVRAAAMLVVLGGGIVTTTLLSGFGTAGSPSFLPLRVGGIVLAAVTNIGVFLLGFRVLTVSDVGWRQLLPGAVVAGLGWQALQAGGSYYITHQLQGASQTYGMFAVVIGLLSWLYLLAQLTLFAAEINVVRAGRLWPRSLAGELTDADRRAYASYAEVEERRPDEDVGVGFTNDPGPSGDARARHGRPAP